MQSFRISALRLASKAAVRTSTASTTPLAIRPSYTRNGLLKSFSAVSARDMSSSASLREAGKPLEEGESRLENPNAAYEAAAAKAGEAQQQATAAPGEQSVDHEQEVEPSAATRTRGDNVKNEDIERTLHIGNFWHDITDDELRTALSQYGNITGMFRQENTGWAFVTFETVKEMEKAHFEVDGTFWQGRRLHAGPRQSRPFRGGRDARVTREPSPPSSVLFIGNISREVQDQDLNNIFGNVSGVKNVRLATDRANGLPLGYAHADFDSVESATKALEMLRGQSIRNMRLRVDYSANKTKSQRRQEKRDQRLQTEAAAPVQDDGSSRGPDWNA